MDIKRKIKNEKRFRLYLETGLAVLLVLTLALAGRAGLLKSGAAGSEPAAADAQKEAEDSAEDVNEKAAEENRQAERRRKKQKKLRHREQYPILGESDVSVQQMRGPILKLPGRSIRKQRFPPEARTP